MGLFVVKVVSATLEVPEDRPFQQVRKRQTLVDGDKGIAVAPENQDRRDFFDLGHAVEEIAALTAPVDDVPHAPRERAG